MVVLRFLEEFYLFIYYFIILFIVSDGVYNTLILKAMLYLLVMKIVITCVY